jgi:hypothetical protein
MSIISEVEIMLTCVMMSKESSVTNLLANLFLSNSARMSSLKSGKLTKNSKSGQEDFASG